MLWRVASWIQYLQIRRLLYLSASGGICYGDNNRPTTAIRLLRCRKRNILRNILGKLNIVVNLNRIPDSPEAKRVHPLKGTRLLGQESRKRWFTYTTRFEIRKVYRIELYLILFHFINIYITCIVYVITRANIAPLEVANGGESPSSSASSSREFIWWWGGYDWSIQVEMSLVIRRWNGNRSLESIFTLNWQISGCVGFCVFNDVDLDDERRRHLPSWSSSLACMPKVKRYFSADFSSWRF